MIATQQRFFDPLPEEAKAFAVNRYGLFQGEIATLRSKRLLLIGGYHWWQSRWFDWAGRTFVGAVKVQTQDCFPDVWLLFESDFTEVMKTR